MSKIIKHISRIRDEFDTVICGVNGVICNGLDFFPESAEALIKLYQSGKKNSSGIKFRNARARFIFTIKASWIADEYFLCNDYSR